MAKADDALNYAMTELGKPYVFGDEGPNTFDCSGLVQYVMAHVGIKLPRVAADQQAATARVTTPVPGDLVFFGMPAHHVGIYIGGGKMIDAPHTGANVRIENVGTPTNYGRVSGLGSASAAVIAPVVAGVQTVASALDPSQWLAGGRQIVLEGLAALAGAGLVGFGIYRLAVRPAQARLQEAISG
jgi:cell wall-associated NlpC family hydrolase